MTDFAATKARFQLPAGVIYLDGNSLGPLPRDAMAHAERVIRDEWGGMLIRAWKGTHGQGGVAVKVRPVKDAAHGAAQGRRQHGQFPGPAVPRAGLDHLVPERQPHAGDGQQHAQGTGPG